MKRIILALASLVAIGGAMAQGTFIFKTKVGTAINAPVTLVNPDSSVIGKANGPEGGSGIGYYGELLVLQAGVYAPVMGIKTGESAERAVREPLMFNATTPNGWINGGTWTVTGIGSGAKSVKVVAYYARTGAETYATLAGLPAGQQVWGQSGAIDLAFGGPVAGAPDAPAGQLSGIQGWNVTVPEPSVLALGLLGMGALMIRRRS